VERDEPRPADDVEAASPRFGSGGRDAAAPPMGGRFSGVVHPRSFHPMPGIALEEVAVERGGR
jgi:hypothetical protein